MKNSQKIGIGVVFLLLVLGSIILWQSFREPSIENVTNFPPAGTKTIAFGDSLVTGYGDQDGGGFVTDLSEDLGVNIKNAGVPGETTAEGLARVDTILEQKPDIVLLLFGGNDTLQSIDQATTQNNLATMITRLQENGAVVMLLGVQGGLLGDPYEAMYENLSETHGTIYVPNILDGIFGHQNLMDDQIHPNEAGYEMIAEKIRPYLQRLLETP